MIVAMQSHTKQLRGRPGSYVVILFPCLFIIVLLMHVRGAADFFRFKWHYVPPDPEQTVSALVRAQNHGSIFRDPHILGYLSLPLLLFCAVALYRVSHDDRPRSSTLGLLVTVSGTIYLGGFFGMWTAFYRGLGAVDPRYLEGAIATFRGMTAPVGAFLMTTSLAKVSFIGLGAQGLLLWGLPGVPRRSAVLIALGCFLVVGFWGLGNWMLIGITLMLVGFFPLVPLWSEPRRDDKPLRTMDRNRKDGIS